MSMIDFEWDENKNISNQRKHRVSFEEARSVFYDENARLMHDPDHSEDGDRYILMGLSSGLRVLVVVHIYKENNEVLAQIYHNSTLSAC